MTDREVRWGIIGPGRIARRFADAVSIVEGTTLAAVASRDLGRASAFANKFGVPESFGSYDELAGSTSVDVVYIATPHNFHFNHVRLCLEAGKHVLCEKPITVNATEAGTLAKIAAKQGCFLMEAMWTVFLPVYERVRRWLDEGTIGQPHLMTSTFGFRATRDLDGRHLNPHLAGGALLDIGVYNIAVSRWAARSDCVSFDAHAILGETGVDESASISLHYPEGLTSQFAITFLCQTANEFSIHGPEGFIRIQAPFWESTRAILTAGEKVTIADQPFQRNGFEYVIEEVVRCLRAGKTESDLMPLAYSIGAMKTLDAIRQKIGLSYPFEKDCYEP